MYSHDDGGIGMSRESEHLIPGFLVVRVMKDMMGMEIARGIKSRSSCRAAWDLYVCFSGVCVHECKMREC